MKIQSRSIILEEIQKIVNVDSSPKAVTVDDLTREFYQSFKIQTTPLLFQTILDQGKIKKTLKPLL